jgi:hypothetical protein
MMTSTTESGQNILESFQALIRNAQSKLLMSEEHESNDSLAQIQKELIQTARKAESFTRRQRYNSITRNEIDSNNTCYLDITTLIPEAYMMGLLIEIVLHWKERNDDASNTLDFAISSVIDCFSSNIINTEQTRPLPQDLSIMELLLWNLFNDVNDDSSNEYLNSYFSVMDRKMTNNDELKISRRISNRLQNTQQLYDNFSEEDDALVILLQLPAILRQERNRCRRRIRHQSGNKRRRINKAQDNCDSSSDEDDVGSIEQQLWKIPFVYCLAKLTYDFLLQQGSSEDRTNTDTTSITVDVLIQKVRSLTNFFPRLQKSIYEHAGIALFLLDILCASDVGHYNAEDYQILSDLTIQRVTEELCRYQ